MRQQHTVMFIVETSNFPFNQLIFICSKLEISYMSYESFDQLTNYFINGPLPTISIPSILYFLRTPVWHRFSSQWLKGTGIWWVGIHGSPKQSMMNRTESTIKKKKIIAPKFNSWEIRKLCSKGLRPGSLSVAVEWVPKFPSMCQTHTSHHFRTHNHSFHNIPLGCCVHQVIPISYSGALTGLRERLGSWAEHWGFLKETSGTLLVSYIVVAPPS